MYKRAAIAILAVVGAVTAFFVLYHPPMRLMPVPLVFREGAGEILGAVPDLVADARIPVFYATNRLPVGTVDDRLYTVAPDRRLHFGTATLRIGDEGVSLGQLYEWTTGAERSDRPFLHLERMAEAATVGQGEAPDADALAFFADIDAALAASRSREILVYVHGANTTVERAAGQAAQLRHFSGRNAVVVLYAWPTAENFLRYPRDIETAFGAAPHLAEFLKLLATHTDADRIGVFTYSAGATIGSDALARLAEEAPEAAARLGEIYHAAPDADFAGFVDDLETYAGDAGRVTVAVNLGDSALRLAQVVNRASRAGRPDLRELDAESAAWLLNAADDDGLEIVQVSPDTMPDLPARSHTFWYDDPWVSGDVLVTLLFHLDPSARGLVSGEASGTRYWTFPADYPARMPGLVEDLRGMVAAE